MRRQVSSRNPLAVGEICASAANCYPHKGKQITIACSTILCHASILRSTTINGQASVRVKDSGTYAAYKGLVMNQ